jgi:hypothetical protein
VAEASFQIHNRCIGNPELERLGCHNEMILVLLSCGKD